jgi:thioredoxin-like negative regulator of GroEL
MSDRSEPEPSIDPGALRESIRTNAVVAIHFRAGWAQCDRTVDETLRAEFAGRIAFHAIDVDHPASGEFALEAGILSVPALGLWVRGRPWKTLSGVQTREHLRDELENALRRSVSRPQNVDVYARDPNYERLLR